VRLVAKAAYGGSIDRDAVRKRAGQLLRHDRDVFRYAEDVAERKADELNVLRGGVIDDFLCGIHFFTASSLK
jgi:hypothetical protein